MRILMVAGSYPPDLCGVGAYTGRLVQSLRKRDFEIEVISKGPWIGFKAIRNIFEIARMKVDVLHIQYPSVGFGHGLAAQLLCLIASHVVVTIHEVSQVHPLRRLSLLPFSIGARHIIFTTEFERQYSIRFAPWIAKKSSVIPLGSSISAGPKIEKHDDRVVHFGLIRPKKGIEDVINAARQSNGLRFLIIGSPDATTREYYEKLRADSKGLPIDWLTDLPDEEVAEHLSRTRFAYMPFPDGATERRTSLLALYANGHVVLTTSSSMTSDRMKAASVIVTSPKDAITQLSRLMSDPSEEDRIRNAALAYLNDFAWPSIAAAHEKVYKT